MTLLSLNLGNIGIIVAFFSFVGFILLYLKAKDNRDKSELWDSDLRGLIFRVRNCPMSEGAFLQFCKEFTELNAKRERNKEHLDVAYKEFNEKYREYFK